MNDIRSSVYAQKVELLLRLIPIVMEEHVFAIHGGTAINLFSHPDADHGRCGQGKKAGKSSGKNPYGQSSVLLSIY